MIMRLFCGSCLCSDEGPWTALKCSRSCDCVLGVGCWYLLDTDTSCVPIMVLEMIFCAHIFSRGGLYYSSDGL